MDVCGTCVRSLHMKLGKNYKCALYIATNQFHQLRPVHSPPRNVVHFRPTVCHSESRRFKTSLAEMFQRATDAQNVEKKETIRTIFRTQEDNPLNHNSSHIGMWYTVSGPEFNKVFRNAVGTPFEIQCKTFQESCVMVRRSALELIDYIKMANFADPPLKLMLHGKVGCGKSVSMCHAMHYCARDGFLIVHVQWPLLWNSQYAEIMDSTHNPSRVDHTYRAAEWLKHFKTQNQVMLKELQTLNKYVWNKRESSEEGTPFLEIIEFGMTRTKYASDCIGVLLKEIRQQSSLGRIKTLVAIDGVNSFWKMSKLKTENRELIPTEKFSLVHNFKKMFKSDWTNGLVICSVDTNATAYEKREDYRPRYLLEKEGFESLDPYIPVSVDKYTDKEAYSCLEYYIERLWIQNPKAQTEEGKKELIFLSDKNPYMMRRISISW